VLRIHTGISEKYTRAIPGITAGSELLKNERVPTYANPAGLPPAAPARAKSG